MQHYLYHETPFPQSHLTRAAIEKPTGDGHFYKLFEGDAVRLAKTQGLRASASFLGLAVHTNEACPNGRKCFPKVPTVARLTGQSTRATSNQLRGLDDDGFIKIQRRKRASSMYTVAHSDSSKQRYARISKRWLEAHCGVGPSALFLLAVLLAMAGPRRTFSRRLDDLFSALDLSHATFYRLAGKLKQRGWLSWRCADGLIELTMLENPVSKTTLLPVSKTAVLVVSKTAHEVASSSEVARSSEEAKSTTTEPTQDQRRAENRAVAAAAVPTFSPFQRRDQDQDDVQHHHVEVADCEYEMEPRATEPPSHDDCQCNSDHMVKIVDGKSHVRYGLCQRWKAWANWQREEREAAEQREPAATGSGFLDMFKPTTPRLPAFVAPQFPGSPTIEAECQQELPTCGPRRHSRAKALPPLTPEEFADCWSIIQNGCRGLVLDGPPLESRRVNGLLKLAKAEGFLRHDLDLDDFDVLLREFADAHVQRRGVSITAKQVSGLISDALREVLGYDDDNSMLGRMGPEADLPDCPRAVYARTHGDESKGEKFFSNAKRILDEANRLVDERLRVTP
jgi:hypothetical protein